MKTHPYSGKKENASKLRDLEEQPYMLSETSKNAEYFGLDNVWETERMDAVLNVMPHFMMQHMHRKRQGRRAQVWGSVVLGLSGKRHFELWPADVYISWSKTKTEKKKRLALCLFKNLHQLKQLLWTSLSNISYSLEAWRQFGKTRIGRHACY